MRRKHGNGHDDAGAPAVADAADSPAPEGAGEAALERGLTPADDGLAAPREIAPGEVEALRRERDELRDQLVRRRADFDNYRKRVERDRNQAGFEAAAAIFRELVATVDNLELALRSGATEDALRKGVELTYRELVTFLESQGVEVHDPAGKAFDPQNHQALMHEPAPGVPEGTVVEVLRKGYSYKDRLLRPALVKVAKGDEEGDGAEGDDGIH